MKNKGIIFDMDNTILRSHINFKHMKQEVYAFLVSKGVAAGDLPLHEFTTATLIEQSRQSPKFTTVVESSVWEICTENEKRGMEHAGLEPGVVDLLEELQASCHLTVLTNNSYEAAIRVLRETKIEPYFDLIAGREQAKLLKPSPSGMKQIIGMYPHLSCNQWLAVGDAWIDGMAAAGAGIPFVAYQANRQEMERRAILPIAFINHISLIKHYL